jgi:N-acyl-D-aspartate/D-glutamate deacylase
VQAKLRGVRALEVIYDHLAQGDGQNLVYFPIFNYLRGQLDSVRDMLMHPQALVSLGDAGAHVGTICDASNTTTLLTHWVRDQGALSLEQAIHMLTQRNAAHLGLKDRGRLAVGQVADLNLIDLAQLAALRPHVVRDLPAGGRRMMQAARGYLGTWVAGQRIHHDGVLTSARPGRLLRAA